MPSLNLRAALKRNPNRLTLKQRAAALKATAARVMGRRAPVPSPEIVATPSGADPQLVALVAEWQDARCKLNDPDFPDGPEADAMGDRDAYLQREIYLFPARTVADLVAKIPAFREEAEDALSGYAGQNPEETLAGAAWAGLIRDIEHLAEVAPTVQAKPDPILASIEASKSAHRVMARWSRMNEGEFLTADDFKDEARLDKEQHSAHDAVLATVPTTAAGRLALLEYLRWQMGVYGMADGQPPEADSPFWRDAYKALKAALAFEGVEQPKPEPDPIHALIAEHRAAYAEWDRLANVWGGMNAGTPEYAAANEAQRSAGKIEVAALKALTQARPTTFAGLLALTEYLPGALRQVDQGEDAEPALRNVAASLRAIGTPLKAEHTALAADLSGCSIRHLARLYETLSARWHIASVTMGAPFVWDGDRYTAAGRILDNECERLAKMMEDIAREMKGREASAEEGDDRLAVLVRQDIEGSGCVTDQALLTDLHNAWKA